MTDIPYTQLSLDELSSLVKRAASNGQLHVLCEILKAHHNREDLRGLAVACAAKQGHLKIIQKLLKNDAAISQECRGQAVINAATDGYPQVIHELLKKKAEITLEDWKNALRCAAENEHLDCVHELAENVPGEVYSKSPRFWPKQKDDFPC